MKVGLHIPDFTWDGGPAALRLRLRDVARQTEQARTRPPSAATATRTRGPTQPASRAGA
jgi:hypothetical protein